MEEVPLQAFLPPPGEGKVCCKLSLCFTALHGCTLNGPHRHANEMYNAKYSTALKRVGIESGLYIVLYLQ